MIRLDSCKIDAPLESIKYIDKSYFVHSEQRKHNEIITDKHTLTGVDIGLNYIEVNNKSQRLKLGISAKILKDDYFDLINKNTIDQVLEAINNTGIIEIDKYKLIEEGVFFNIDSTNNLKVSKSIPGYVNALNTYKVNNRYNIIPYRENKNNGIEFKGKQRSFKERMIMYCKYDELLKYKGSEEFIKSVSNPVDLLCQFENILRVEQNHVSLKKIRERFSTSDTKILSILNSNTKPNFNLFKKVTSKIQQMTLFDTMQDLKLYEIEKIKGRERIIQECSYDMDLIKQFLKSKINGNISRYIKEYQTLMFILLNEETKEPYLFQPLVSEIEYLLKSA